MCRCVLSNSKATANTAQPFKMWGNSGKLTSRAVRPRGKRYGHLFSNNRLIYLLYNPPRGLLSDGARQSFSRPHYSCSREVCCTVIEFNAYPKRSKYWLEHFLPFRRVRKWTDPFRDTGGPIPYSRRLTLLFFRCHLLYSTDN